VSYKPSGLTVLSKADFTDGPVGATLTDTVGGINLVKASNGSAQLLVGMYKAAPAAPYTLTVRVVPNGNDPESGIVSAGIYVSDGTKYAALVLSPNLTTAAKMDLGVRYFTNTTTLDGTSPAQVTQTLFGTVWLRLNDDNANRTWSISRDGKTFSQVSHVARTTFVTPTRVGFLANAYSAATNVTFDSWKVT
jgi:hypothetical protein